VLEDRAYVERQEKRFIPTVIGTTVVEFLVKNFDAVMDYDFTAKMEDDLDEIANGNKQWRKVMAQFWKPFDQKLEKAKDADRVKVPVEQTGRKCPGEDNAGCAFAGNLVIRSGRFGKFISCDKYPECKYTERLVEKLEGFVCPECGGEVVMKRTRKGRSFWGCANYPKCEYASWKDPREKVKK
jgi:DNA topoisomerase-1